jgi:hypothetical protein
MSDHERGAYSPHNDAPTAFDARQSSGGGGFPTTLVISVVILAILIFAIVMFYRSGIRGAGEGPAPIGTPVAQIKAPAPGSAQPSDEAAGLQIYKSEGAPESSAPLVAPTFAAPPEQPKPRLAAPVPAKPTAVAPPAAAQPVAPQPDEIGALLDKSNAAAKAASAPAATGPASAQIGAYSSEDLAAKGWSDIAAAFSADMSGKGKHFEPVTKDGKTLYRAAVTGFASKAQAQAFCAKLKAAGRACFVK